MPDRDTSPGPRLHDLRNPLAAIQTAMTMIAEMPDQTPLSALRSRLRLVEVAVARTVGLLDAYERSDAYECDTGRTSDPSDA